jgi:hypothetical protein
MFTAFTPLRNSCGDSAAVVRFDQPLISLWGNVAASALSTLPCQPHVLAKYCLPSAKCILHAYLASEIARPILGSLRLWWLVEARPGLSCMIVEVMVEFNMA